MEELLLFNLNDEVRVRITDEGIEKYVKEANSILPFQLHTCFEKFKSQADKDGYHRVQFHWLLDNFGNCGLRVTNYIDINILFDSKNFKALK